ncbi:MAG: pentapeptide repeat-containing protein [Anaerolineales bacterium]|nr:pentapeptide repeat-containing protein [Anaerolineales bacterium]
MKRSYFAVLILAVSALACSVGGGSQPGDDVPDVAPSVEAAPIGEGESLGASPTQPELPVVEAGDCGAGVGPNLNLALCDLSDRNLSGSNFSNANLAQAKLSESNLSKADFSNANLAGAVASESNMSGANFTGADLTSANLSSSNLMGADFSNAITLGVDFSDCNMTGAIITQEQLDQAFSVKSAILPDGSIGQ